MNTKKQLYKFVGIFSALIYLFIVIFSIFNNENLELLAILPYLLAIFLSPAIYLAFAGIGEILDYIQTKELLETSINNVDNSDKSEEVEPVQLEISLEENSSEKEDADEDEQEDDKEDENTTEEVNNDEEVKVEPIIKNGKIQCRYCGKYNKIKRTYCYLCAKKLKD